MREPDLPQFKTHSVELPNRFLQVAVSKTLRRGRSARPPGLISPERFRYSPKTSRQLASPARGRYAAGRGDVLSYEYQIVRLKRPTGGLAAGAVGTVVMAYRYPKPGYEVMSQPRGAGTLPHKLWRQTRKLLFSDRLSG